MAPCAPLPRHHRVAAWHVTISSRQSTAPPQLRRTNWDAVGPNTQHRRTRRRASLSCGLPTPCHCTHPPYSGAPRPLDFRIVVMILRAVDPCMLSTKPTFRTVQSPLWPLTTGCSLGPEIRVRHMAVNPWSG